VLGVACFMAVLAMPPVVNVMNMQDSPGLAPKPGAPNPDSEGISVEEVVNTRKRAVIVIMSNATIESMHARNAIRQTWLQALNRSSEYTLGPDDRKSFATWFMIARDNSNPAVMTMIEAEGRMHGDILVVDSVGGAVPDLIDNVGAVLRWLRVAYYNRFDLAMITVDDTFVSMYNLLEFCKENEGKPYFYGGYVNRYEVAPVSFHHKYYTPFVESGTIIIGSETAELMSKYLTLLKHLPRYDATLGYFLSTYDVITPTHDSRFIPALDKVYEAVPNVIAINHVTPEQMLAFSKAKCSEGKCETPGLPAQVKEFKSTYVYVDPYPKGPIPECDGSAKCALDALKAMEDQLTHHKRRH